MINNYFITKEENINFELKRIDAVNASQKIFLGNNCLEFGLNGGDGLSLKKISCVEEQNYFDLRENLGLNNYEFYFELKNETQVLLEKGIQTNKDAFPIIRFGILDGELVKGVLILYDK